MDSKDFYIYSVFFYLLSECYSKTVIVISLLIFTLSRPYAGDGTIQQVYDQALWYRCIFSHMSAYIYIPTVFRNFRTI